MDGPMRIHEFENRKSYFRLSQQQDVQETSTHDLDNVRSRSERCERGRYGSCKVGMVDKRQEFCLELKGHSDEELRKRT